VLRPAHGRGRIGRHDLPGDEPVKQHADRRKLLLHIRCGMGLLPGLYIGRYVERPDCHQRQAAVLAPGEELAARPSIGAARVGVADMGGEEVDIAPRRLVAGRSDKGGNDRSVDRHRDGARQDDRGELIRGHAPFPSTHLEHDKGRYHAEL
jgi:hypothetical protein